MKKQEIEQISKAAKGKDLNAAIAAFLGCELELKAAGGKVPAGFEAAFYNIAFEVDQWNAADQETRDGIESYKAAKDIEAMAAAAEAPAEKPKARTRSKKA